MPALRQPVVATSLPKLFLQGNHKQWLQKTSPTDPRRQKNTAHKTPEKYTDSNMVNYHNSANYDGSTECRL